jgi:hypothetical protein
MPLSSLLGGDTKIVYVPNIEFMKAAQESGTGVDTHGYEYEIDAYGDERYYEEPGPVAYGEERFNPRCGRRRGRGGYSRGRVYTHASWCVL